MACLSKILETIMEEQITTLSPVPEHSDPFYSYSANPLHPEQSSRDICINDVLESRAELLKLLELHDHALKRMQEVKDAENM